MVYSQFPNPINFSGSGFSLYAIWHGTANLYWMLRWWRQDHILSAAEAAAVTGVDAPDADAEVENLESVTADDDEDDDFGLDVFDDIMDDDAFLG